MKYRMIGPNRGGRVTAVTGVPSQPYTFYMGSTGGGVWKTTDAGHLVAEHFGQILQGGVDGRDGGFAFQSQRGLRRDRLVEDPQQCLDRPRHLQIHRRRQDVDWIGLRDTGQIATVRVHPTNPDIVYAATLGNPFAPNPDRGVFRSKDGGKTWQKVLYFPTRWAQPIWSFTRQPQRDFRLHVARRAQAVDHHQRRARRRHLQEHRRRRHLEQTRRRTAQRTFRPPNVAISASSRTASTR